MTHEKLHATLNGGSKVDSIRVSSRSIADLHAVQNGSKKDSHGRISAALIASMSLLSLAMRYPGNHEIGVDSFAIHTIAQSVVTHGSASWIVNPLSFFGWYPASYPSGGPFLLASISTVGQLNMETAILGLSLLLGPVGILTAFLMAREFRGNQFFALAVAFAYGLAPRFLAFTLWQASTRNLFMAFLPLFVWSILRLHRRRNLPNLVVAVTITSILAASHRLVVLVVIVGGALLVAIILHEFIRILKAARPSLLLRYSQLGITRWITLAAIGTVGLGVLFGSGVLSEYDVGELASGTGLSVESLNLGVSITRSVGLAAPLAIVGIIYSPWVRNSTTREMFSVTALVGLIPTLLLRDYTGFYILPFLALFAAYGLVGILNALRKHRRVAACVVAAAVIGISSLSGFVLQYEKEQNPPMSTEAYASSLYIVNADSQRATVVCNDEVTCSRMAAITGLDVTPVAGSTSNDPGPEMFVFGFYSGEELGQRLTRIPFQDLTIDSNSLWTTSGIDLHSDYVAIIGANYGQIPSSLNARYHPAYYLEITVGFGRFYGNNGVSYPAPMALSLHKDSYALYADGNQILWWMLQP